MNDTSDHPGGATVVTAASPAGDPGPDRGTASVDVSPRRHNRDPGPQGIDGVSGFMGMRWVSANAIRLTIRPELLGAGGLLSGVATYALVDYRMGSALWVHTTEDEHIATVNISINYLQSATEGEVVCTTQLDRRNRSNAILRGEVRHEDGRLLVTAIGSYAIFPARHRPPAG